MKGRAGLKWGEGWLIAAGIACAALLCLLLFLEERPREMLLTRVAGRSAGEIALPEPGPVDINSASAEELAGLPGIGEELAGRILQFRQEHGPFACVEELDEVPGIGETRLAELEGLVFCG